MISECGCESGCPACVVSPKCGNGNEPLSKSGALQVLGLLKPRE
jgi:DEAD/DEAH box helicase domain-containing protein